MRMVDELRGLGGKNRTVRLRPLGRNARAPRRWMRVRRLGRSAGAGSGERAADPYSRLCDNLEYGTRLFKVRWIGTGEP